MRRIILKWSGSSILIMLNLLCLLSCSQNEKIGLDPTDNIAPAAPTDILVENINGGAIISYTAPQDDDLLYVVAAYTVNGVERTTKASPYNNSLELEGFKEGEYEVILKSFDKSKNESSPVRIVIHPLTAPVELIYKSLKVVDSFGGVKLAWNNAAEVNIIVEAFMKYDDDWVSVENFYSSAKEGKATIRGFEPEPVTFKFRIRDRWDNYSDFLQTNNLPLKEEQLDKSKFRTVIPLPGDSPVYGTSYSIDRIWDGNTVSRCYHGGGNDINRTITFDMGVVAKISRFKMWQRTESPVWIYNHNNLKRYVIYGCNEITEEMRSGGWEDETGMVFPTFEGWTEIINAQCYKPSGDTGTVTNEDKEYILNGDDQEVSIDAPAFRYVRIYMLETWSGGTFTQIGEMTFWGQVVENN